MITLLDYGAGNVRSVINAIESLGESVKIVRRGDDILSAERLIFPGVGAFGAMMEILEEKRFLAPLTQYLTEGRPFFWHLPRDARPLRVQRGGPRGSGAGDLQRNRAAL